MRDRILAALILEEAWRECQVLRRSFWISDNPHENVHSARKSIRRLRSVLALFGRDDGGMLLLSKRLQTMAYGLSSLRDAHVALELATQMAREERDGNGSAWATSINRLAELEQALLKQVLIDDPGFELQRTEVETLCVRLRTSCTFHVRASQIRQALEYSEHRLDRARHAAHRRPEAGSIHRWRRKARRFKMQLQTVARLNETAQVSLAVHSRKSHRNELGHVVDALGYIQDVYLLRALLEEHVPQEICAALILATDHALTRSAYETGYFSSPICLGTKARKEPLRPVVKAVSALSIDRTPSPA
ncbi:MAG: CHAD domain-containing protein [Stenotrophomonas sp.]